MRLLILFAAALLLHLHLAAGLSAAQNPPAKAPNVLIVICDDLGYGDLACFGHPTIRTPNLDRFAADGLKLTQHYSTAPVCSASRVGLLTGRTPTRVSVYDWIPENHPMHMGREEITIAALLKKAGYDTGQFGKWHCNGEFNKPTQPQPGDHGFDHWFSTQNNAGPSHLNPHNFVRNGQPVGQLEGYSCQLVADETIAWLKGRADRTKPFFAYVCFHEPHEPVASPPEIVEEYVKLGVTPREKAEYFANVTNLDAAFGKLLAALSEMKVADNTLVIFTSDNGPETLNRYPNAKRCYGSPGPLRGMKLWVTDGGIHVPGLMRLPGRIKPGVTHEPIGAIDFLPTVAELAGAPLPNDRTYDGVSLVPFFAGQPLRRSTPLFWHYYNALSEHKVALIDGEYKLLATWDTTAFPPVQRMTADDWQRMKQAKLATFELYNLRTDPAEASNLAASDPATTRRLTELTQAKYADVLSHAKIWPAGPIAPTPAAKRKKSN